MQSDRYRQRSKRRDGAYGKKSKNKKHNIGGDYYQEDTSFQDDPELELVGVKPPGFLDIFAVKLVLLPFFIIYWIYSGFRWIYRYKILGKPRPGTKKYFREQGWSEEKIEQYEDYVRSVRRQQRRRMKRRRR
eukprot:TRINITY_DN17778_c0_g1_i1.p1 TRINITY_DN17778_c0_g1~~TRINITY_DN17778_c0_g1_i1.p1  ORF type:complete len:132 (-),score=12.45 TRINITY_DN17778_c0_g1_i1:64-459(-)